jgi:hypothetical protein
MESQRFNSALSSLLSLYFLPFSSSLFLHSFRPFLSFSLLSLLFPPISPFPSYLSFSLLSLLFPPFSPFSSFLFFSFLFSPISSFLSFPFLPRFYTSVFLKREDKKRKTTVSLEIIFPVDIRPRQR